MGVSLEVIWFDDDVIGLRVRCESPRFAGTTECYVEHSFFATLAARLRGFPSSLQDRRSVEVGTFEPHTAGGGVRLTLRVLNAAAHAVADVRVRNPGDARGTDETAQFSFAVEPAAVDDFVDALSRMHVSVGASAQLRDAR